MSSNELTCTYASLILHDDGIPIIPEKIVTLVKAAGVSVESYWPSRFAKLVEKRNIEDLILNAAGGDAAPVAVPALAGGAAPAVEEKKKEEPKEESEDDDIGFSLCD